MIVLLRHGIAEDFHPKGDQFRPLTDKGIKKLEKTIAPFIGELQIDFKLLVSPYLRARQTAEVLKRYKNFSDEIILDSLAPDADYLDAAKEIQENSVIVSHLPLLPYLTSYILTGSPNGVSMEFKKGGAALIEGKILKSLINF